MELIPLLPSNSIEHGLEKSWLQGPRLPCDHEEVSDNTDELEERLVRHVIEVHGYGDSQDLRAMIRKNVRQFQMLVGR